MARLREEMMLRIGRRFAAVCAAAICSAFGGAAWAAGADVAAQDLLSHVKASERGSYTGTTLQCMGGKPKWDPPRANELVSGNDGKPRFAVVAAPGQAAEKAFYFAVRKEDPDTLGTNVRRCEIAVARVPLPRNRDFWWGTAVKADDWSGTKDRQILWQWHDGDDAPRGLDPFLSLIAEGNTLRLMVASSTAAQDKATRDNSTSEMVNSTINWKASDWLRFVVQARVDTNNQNNGFVRVWMNGTLVADYHGPLGYRLTAPDYAKIGLYHWLGNNQNPIDQRYPLRQVWNKGTVLAYHRDGYNWESIDRLLGGGSSGGGADTQAPSAPTGLKATAVQQTSVSLAWSASTDNVGVTRYEVWRCLTSRCNDSWTMVGSTGGLSFTNTGLAASTDYSYGIRAFDAANNKSASSIIVPVRTAAAPAAPGDRSAPKVIILGPAANSLAAGTVTISALAVDNVGVKRVEFYVNGKLMATDTSMPYAYNWHASLMMRQSTIEVRAYDAAGNVGSAQVSVRGKGLGFIKPSVNFYPR
jgi:hypothetical protein